MSTHTGDYAIKGDYHVNLDKKWKYYPVYITKMQKIDRLLKDKKDAKILDVGCGEGVLVKRYKELGYNISGLDYNYTSDLVKKGDITDIPYEDNSFDMIMCLDVIEHLNILDQEKAVSELARITKPEGQAIITIPNLAHFASRLTFLVFGKFIRTADVDRHPADRPYGELKKILAKNFNITKEEGLFPTFPLISALTFMIPGKVVWMHKLYNALFGWMAGFCFLNLTIGKPKK